MPEPDQAAFMRQVPYLLMGDKKEETVETHRGTAVYRVRTTPRRDGSDSLHWSAGGIDIKSFELHVIAAASGIELNLIFEIPPSIAAAERSIQ